MNLKAPIFFVIAAVGGFFTGALIDGELEAHSFRVPSIELMNFGSDTFSLIQNAELSGNGQQIIEHAYVDFTIEQIPVGDNFKNVVNECIFRSDQSFGGEVYPDDSIDDGICIICKLKGECTNVDEDFVTLEHGAKLGSINSVLATNGIFLSIDARQNRPDTAIIFDGDTGGGPTDTPTEPDPDMRASGICTDCAGLHMVVIPENVDDDDNDNLVDYPNDSAAGGIQRYQFELPRKIVSFDFADMDRSSAAVHEARAYSDFSCTQMIGSPVTIPNGADGNVQTITMNKDNTRCLEIEYHDSGGVTNLVLECVGWEADGTILGVGGVNLEDGYTANEEIHIPIDGMIDVRKPKHVEVKIQSVVLTFHGLNHGDVLNDQFLASYGIKISGFKDLARTQPQDPVVFDTELSNTRDPDLEVEIGNISIVQENQDGCGDGTCDFPDDDVDGGIQIFQFDPKRYVNSLVWIDADRPEPFGEVLLYRDYDCTDKIVQTGPTATLNGGINVPFAGDGSTQVLVPVNVEKVGCMEAVYDDSSGLSRINLGCPLPDDPVTIPWFDGGEHQDRDMEEKIFWTDFENPWEREEWSSSYSVSGDYFNILSSGGDWNAYLEPEGGHKVLAGWGNFDPTEAAYTRNPIDISDYHSVIVSVAYSYEDTEDADEFFFSYKDGLDWVRIVDIPSPQSSSSQFPWTLAEANIPDHIDSLEFEFRWSTSSGSEHVMIDNLQVFGIPN